MARADLIGGFANPAHDAAHAFRAALEALARPGQIHTLGGGAGPAPLSVAAASLMLTLCDGTTPIHLAPSHDSDAIRDWITFQIGAPLVRAEDAQFAVGDWPSLCPVDRFAIGTPAYPDRAATLIVEVPTLLAAGARLRGPGIKRTAQLNLPDIAAHQANARQFPLGFDCFFTSGDRLAGLPRSTQVED